MKIGTHNGTFHCDEVLACAMLKYLPEYKEAEIVRTRDNKLLDGCDIVVDVGAVFDPAKHRYDHHQKSFTDSMKTLLPGKKWETKLSSAGLVYAHFGKRILREILENDPSVKDVIDDALVERLYDKVYEKFVEEVDAVDNGIATHDGEPRYQVTTTLSSRVGNFRPAWNDAVQDYDAGFYKALAMVRLEFEERVKFYAKVWWPARTVVAKALEKRFEVHQSGKILAFDEQFCPYKEHLFELEQEQGIAGEILYVLFEDETNKSWRVGTVPVHPGSFECRKTLHAEWKALRGEDLDAKSGIKGCVFVHAAGFIGGHQDRQGALEMAVKSLEHQLDENAAN